MPETTKQIIGLIPPVLAVGLTLSLFDILEKKEKEKKLKKEVI